MHPTILRSFFAFVLLTRVSNAVLMNQTVDDGLGDSLAGLQVQYSPGETKGVLVWKSQDTCNGSCTITPDSTKAYNNTWSSATASGSQNITAIFPFRGTAIYVYFIIPNIPVSTEIISAANCDFLVDGMPAGSYNHTPDGSLELQYNTLVYANTSLSDTAHTFLIQVKKNSFVIFDYAQYTIDVQAPISPATAATASGLPEPASMSITASTSSASTTNTPAGTTSHVGAIAGAIVSGVAGIALIALAVTLYYRRTRQRVKHDGAPVTSPFISGGFPATTSVPHSEIKHWRTDPPIPQDQTELEHWESHLYQTRAALYSPGDRPGSASGPVEAETRVESWGWNTDGRSHRDSSRRLTVGRPTQTLARSPPPYVE